jgi:hypothetical protein
MLCLDLPAIVEAESGMVHDSLKSLQLCSYMLLRGAYTSDIKYTPATLPRDMALPRGTEDNPLFRAKWVRTLTQTITKTSSPDPIDALVGLSPRRSHLGEDERRRVRWLRHAAANGVRPKYRASTATFWLEVGVRMLTEC